MENVTRSHPLFDHFYLIDRWRSLDNRVGSTRDLIEAVFIAVSGNGCESPIIYQVASKSREQVGETLPSWLATCN